MLQPLLSSLHPGLGLESLCSDPHSFLYGGCWSAFTGVLAGSWRGCVCIRTLHQPLSHFPQANSTMEVPVTPSPLPKEDGKESVTPIHQHNPLHPHHHHEVSGEKATDLRGGHEPATHAHHHHGDHGQPHHEGKKRKEGNEH